MKKMNKQKGITLIALVITIIVLLILAGVAISMLSGENGILKQAGEAKTKTENSSFIEKVRIASMATMMDENSNIETELKNVGIDEENIISYGNNEYVITNGTEKVIVNSNGNVENGEKITDIDIELQKYFNDKELPYKCKDGYITGFKIEFDESETVEEFENNLPDGYEVRLYYDYETRLDNNITDKSNTSIATGMSVQKNEIEVARTIVFGDTNCDGWVDYQDAGDIYSYMAFGDDEIHRIVKDFQKMACDVTGDYEITHRDPIDIYLFELEENEINQSRLAVNSKRYYKELQKYIARLNKKTGYTFEYNEEKDTYKLKGVKANTTIANLIKALPQDDRISINEEKETTDMVETGMYVQMEIKYISAAIGNRESSNVLNFAYIEVET